MQLPNFLQRAFGGGKRKKQPEAVDPRLSPEGAAAVAERAADPDPQEARAPLAPYPSIDRWPTIVGSAVTLQYISSVFRLCITGYRREYVDLLDELLERDPHTYAVVAQRVLAVSGGRITIVPAKTKPGSTDEKRAKEIAEAVEARITAIPDFQQSLSKLQWGGIFYGVGAAEISWRQDENGWYPARLHWIHSRRLNYPDPGSWSVRIWDQGMVSSWDLGEDPTAGIFGIKVEDFPGKFLVHTPSVRGNYPTRDGLGRQVAYWSALKLMGARGASQFIERFAKPWVIGYYSTQDDGKPRIATPDDIAAIDAAGRALGIGTLTNAALPDSAKLELQGPAANGTAQGRLIHSPFITICNSEISKAVLGQTDTTDAGANGSRAAVQVRKDGTYELYQYDAGCMADTLEAGLVRWIVVLNYPGEERLAPRVKIHAAEKPDVDAMLDRAVKLAGSGAPVDADEVAEQCGVPLLQEPEEGEEPEGRRLYPLAQLKPYEAQSLMKLDRGEELEPPPKLIQPSAEAGGDEASVENQDQEDQSNGT